MRRSRLGWVIPMAAVPLVSMAAYGILAAAGWVGSGWLLSAQLAVPPLLLLLGARHFGGITLPSDVLRIHFQAWPAQASGSDVSVHQPHARIVLDSLLVAIRGKRLKIALLNLICANAAVAVAFAMESGFRTVTVGSHLLNGSGARKRLIAWVLSENPGLWHEVAIAPISPASRFFLGLIVRRKKGFPAFETQIRFERRYSH